MPEGQGYASWAGIGVQSTLGTPVARTKFIDFKSEGVELQLQQKPWIGASETADRINTEVGRHSEGSMEVMGAFEGLESFFKALFGNNSVVTAVLSGTANSHTFTPKDSMKSPGLSLEINRDVIAFLYEGCQVEEVEFVQDSAEYLVVRFLFRGRDETQVSASTPTFVPVLKIHASQLVFKVATVVTPINSYRISFKNNLTGFRPQLGTVVTREIIRGAKRSVTGEITIQFEDQNRYNEFKALTNVALQWVYTGGAISGGGGNNYTLQIDMPQVNWQGRTPTVPGPGPLAVTFPFKAFMTGRATNDDISLVLKNAITSVT